MTYLPDRTPPSSFSYDANTVLFADLVALFVGCGVVDQAEVVLDAAGNDDQEQPGGLASGGESARAAAPQEDKAARRGVKGVPAAASKVSPPNRMDSAPSNT